MAIGLLIPEGPPAPREPLLPPRDIRPTDRLWYLLLIVYAVAFIPMLFNGFFSSLVVQNDARQQVSMYWSFHGTGLVEGGLIRDYLYQYTPLGHKALYWVATLVTSPVMASQILTLLLVAITVLCCWRIGRAARSPAVGAVLGLLMLHGYAGTSLLGGLPRSFAPPVALGFLYFLLLGSERGVLAMLLLAAAFYPSLFAVLVVAWGLQVLLDGIRGGVAAAGPRLIRLAVVAGLAGLMLLPNLMTSDAIGPPITLAEAETMPEWHMGGRFRELPLPSAPAGLARMALVAIGCNDMKALLARSTAAQAKTWGLCAAWLVVGAILFLRGPARRFLPRLLVLLIASALMYLAARAMAFRLFIPGRMLVYTWPPVLALILCLGLASAPTLPWRNRRIDLRVPLFIGLLASVVLLFGPDSGSLGRGMNDLRPNAALYDYLRSTPKNVLVAGDPRETDNIFTFSARNIYNSHLASHPLYPKYYAEIRRRILACQAAYFATRPEDAAAFFRQEKIDLFVVCVDHYKKGGLRQYRSFLPYKAQLEEALADTPPEAFVLSRDDAPGLVFRSGSFRVFDARQYVAAVESGATDGLPARAPPAPASSLTPEPAGL
jgi:hypothetical protein